MEKILPTVWHTYQLLDNKLTGKKLDQQKLDDSSTDTLQPYQLESQPLFVGIRIQLRYLNKSKQD